MTQCAFALPALIDVSAELVEHASEFSTEFADLIVSLRGYVDREIVCAPDDSELSGQNAERGDHRAMQQNHHQKAENHSLDEKPQKAQAIDVGRPLGDLSRKVHAQDERRSAGEIPQERIDIEVFAIWIGNRVQTTCAIGE